MDGQTMKTAARIRSAVKSLGKRGPGRRYPEAVNRDVLAYLAERRRAGRGIAATSTELGIPERSTKLWSGAPRPSSAPTFVPVTVATAAEDTHVFVEREICDEGLQPPVFVLELLHAPHLGDAHAGVLLLPGVIGRLTNPELPANLRDRDTGIHLPERFEICSSVNLDFRIGDSLF